jgi:Uma2 family endonuclease
MPSDGVSEPLRKYGQTRHALNSNDSLGRKKNWTEEEYLALETNQLVEFKNGALELLPMPDYFHQFISRLFENKLMTHKSVAKGGRVVRAPFRLNLPNGDYREPDVLFLAHNQFGQIRNRRMDGRRFGRGDHQPRRRTTRHDRKTRGYAEAGIPEYWIVDPARDAITVLKLIGKSYVEHGIFTRGQRATSALLKGFGISVSVVFDAGK